MSTLLASDGTPVSASNTRELYPEMALRADGSHVIGMSDGTNWHHPMLVQPTAQGISFGPILLLFEEKVMIKMPALTPGNGVVHVGKPDVGLGRAYGEAYLKLRASVAGIIPAGHMPPSDMSVLSGLNVSGGRR